MSVNPVPEKYNTVSAYIFVKDSEAALEFYQLAFGAKTGVCLRGPGGNGIMHAEFTIGNSTIMISDENPDWGTKSAETMGGSPMSFHLYVDDVDAVYNKAIAAGCTLVAPVEDQFWGDRMGKLQDPFGFQWGIASQIEELSDEEMVKRGEEWMKQMMGG